MTWTCPACEKSIDPLRAGAVTAFDDGFVYFCDRRCRDNYAGTREPAVRAGIEGGRHSPPFGHRDESPRAGAVTVEASSAAKFPSPRHGGTRSAAAAHAAKAGGLPMVEAAPSSVPPPVSERAPSSSMRFWSALAVAARPAPSDHADAQGRSAEFSPAAAAALARGAMVGGVLCVCLGLAGSAPAVLYTRMALAVVAESALAMRVWRMRADPLWPNPIVQLLGGVCPIAVMALGLREASIDDVIVFAGLVAVARALAMNVADRLLGPLASARTRIAAALDTPARRLAEGGLEEIVPSHLIRPGDELLLGPGETLSADGVVIHGEVAVAPWPEAMETARRREGDPMVAGAQVITGRARVRVSHVGYDRVWARMMLDPRRRPDVRGRYARAGRSIATIGGAAVTLLSGLAAYANGEKPLVIAMVITGALGIVSNAAVAAIAPTHIGRGVLSALRRGIGFRGATEWDRAGEVSVAAFCARSTLLVGAPELADLVAVARHTDEQILALAAGAESSSHTPEASAIERASLQRRIRPDAVRSPTVQPGLGITAIASTGEPLCVGSRALMLSERISVASAEQIMAEIEAHGRQVLLVALGGKLVGVMGLQDGLRPGARAAVQQVLDAQVEPVLLSGDSRETCEAIGRALDIDHLRPEIAAADRAHEVERLSQGGLVVAVFGNPHEDESALAAAPVAVALGSAGVGPGEWAIALASHDVRDGALGIALARRTRTEARTGLSLALAPGVLTILAVAFGLLPPLCAPVASCIAALAAALHARGSDPLGRPSTRASGHELA